MRQKIFSLYILHVIAFEFVFEMPRNRSYSFSTPFLFSKRERAFFSKCHIFHVQKSWNFQNQMEKWGISRFSNLKKGFTRWKNVIDLKSRTKPKISMTDSGAVKKNKCHHGQNKSFIYFFRAFQVTFRFQINHFSPGIGDNATKFRVPTSFRQSMKLFQQISDSSTARKLSFKTVVIEFLSHWGLLNTLLQTLGLIFWSEHWTNQSKLCFVIRLINLAKESVD